MVFWRKKKNQSAAEEEMRDDAMLHPKGEPDIEPSTDYEAEIDTDTKNEIYEKDNAVIEDLKFTPAPEKTVNDEDLDNDHSDEGGWLSRLTTGLSKSTTKFTKNIGDVLTKKKLDQDALEQLEDALIEADLGPKTAAKIIAEFSKDRFGKDINEIEIREALAQCVSKILEPVAKPLAIQKPNNGAPYVILMTGVNGAGKTTTIGKLAQQFKREGKTVMMAAGDTFRAAAKEQLKIWSERAGCTLIEKDIGADAAALAYEAYNQAKAQGVDVLLIDTAGRLQNKTNLMEELAKIVRVLKKQDENVPHATLLVLDSTTGQNAFSQVETFKNIVDVTGLIVTKLDGSAKGGVLVGLADQFGVPVHAIGVGEAIEDLQPFCAREYARSLMGLEG